MGGSLTLFRLWGIDIQVHWSFVLILAYGAIVYGAGPAGFVAGAIYGILIILLLFVCVILHELGHAVMAKYYKVNVPTITLLPIGGVAQLERMPRKPLQEFLIALAGPFVNFVLVGLLLPITLFIVGMDVRSGSLRIGTASLMAHMQTPSFSGLLLYLTGTNLLLGIFNLLPAFPMDGGRILRALLALAIPYVRATRVAVLVGRGMAFLFALWGIFGGGIFLLLIAFFVYVGGRAELEAVESRSALKDIRARQALTADATKLYTSEKINKAVDLILSSYQADFPVFDLANHFAGVLTRNRLIRVLREAGPEARIADAMIPAESIPVVEPNTLLADVWDTMIQNHTRVVVVKETGGLFQGLITLEDISEVIEVMGATRDSELRRSSSMGSAEESLPKV